MGRSAAAGKDFVLQLVRSPDQDGEPPIRVTAGAAPKKGAPAAGKLSLDADWIVEHAAQAARTLPGGLDVLGVYVFCDDKTFASGHAAVAAALKGIAAEGVGPAAAPPLALHADSVTAKVAARELAGGALKPCDVKPSALLSSMVALRCAFPVSLFLSLAGPKQKVKDALTAAVAWQTEHRVAPAVALLDGRPLAPGQQVGEAARVELLPPLGGAPLAAVGGPDGGAASGSGEYQRVAAFTLEGALDCRAYVHKREPAAAAVAALKADVGRSLLARLEVLVEAAEMAEAVAADRHETAVVDGDAGPIPPRTPPRHPLLLRASSAAAYRMALPRRAFVGWAQGGAAYCDYLVEGEGAAEAAARIQELMGSGAVDVGSYECKEAVTAGGGGKGGHRPAGAGLECSAATAGAGVAAVVAIWLAYTFMG